MTVQENPPAPAAPERQEDKEKIVIIKEFSIRKRDGSKRHLVSPSKETKAWMQRYVNKLNNYPKNDYSHGFVIERNAVTNAIMHTGFAVTISFDIKNFFDSVSYEHLGRVSHHITDKVLYKGHARQGLPTSPPLCNIAAYKLDAAIVAYLEKRKVLYSYTRYADDLSISLDEVTRKDIRGIIGTVGKIVRQQRFRLNDKKTQVHYASSGGRDVCGVIAGADDARPRKRHTHKVRALKHLITNQLMLATSEMAGDRHKLKVWKRRYKKLRQQRHGLEEWCRLRIPKTREQKVAIAAKRNKAQAFLDEANAILRKYKLPAKMAYTEHMFSEVHVPDPEGDFYITNDPRYFAIMSAVGNSWTSCMNVIRSKHTYRRGLSFWQLLRGCSVAYIATGKKIDVNGVLFNQMAARVLIFQKKSGDKVWSKIWGGAKAQIERHLESLGFISSLDSHVKGRVYGNVSKSIPKPYFDRGTIDDVTTKGTEGKMVGYSL